VHLIAGVAPTDLGLQGITAHQSIYRCGHVLVHRQAVALLQLHQHIKRGWRAALEHGLLGAAPAGFFIR